MASGMASSATNGRSKASTKKGSQHITNADMIIPRVVDALRSFASWNLSFFWCGELLWSKSLAMWLLWAKFERDERILLVVSFWLLSDESLLRSLLCGWLGISCEGDLLMVWMGLVGVLFWLFWSMGHCDSLDFRWLEKHRPMALSVLSTLICNNENEIQTELWYRSLAGRNLMSFTSDPAVLKLMAQLDDSANKWNQLWQTKRRI